jgi:tetratricopeptide (TPR) repeat protein
MADEITSGSPPDRVMRVFVSSTFRDMQEERDELIKQIFPQLRNLCEERGVTWGEVDLRWGITDEEASEGKVLPICLDEIKNCRPYFIGLLGERYGWVPDSIPQELIDQESWLTEHQEHSITELEILHGVLNNPEMASHAFFYFRDPAYLERLDEAVKPDYMEIPSASEIEQFGIQEADHRANQRREKLAKLKASIVESGFPVRTDYQDPVALGELVLQDMIAVIHKLFPEELIPDPLEREKLEHEAVISKHAESYIARERYFERLEDHVSGDDDPLVILGESGSGKSALLANWVIRYRSKNPQAVVIIHFIGSTQDSADWKAMLRRIMGEIQNRFGITVEIPEEPGALKSAFSNLLHQVSASNRLVLVLDGLNQIEDRDAALDLVWLPPTIPKNIRLIVSTLPGRPLDELKKRSCPSMIVEPIHENERKLLIEKVLAQYRKTLNPLQIDRIAEAPQSSNPLYLRTLLEELRLFGIHEKLNIQIDSYLEAISPETLYEKILARYEQDYERDRKNLIQDTMQLLWASRRGLSETELLDLLGSEEGLPLPSAYWSPLYLATEQSFTNRVGLLCYAHDYLRQAVENRYLSTESERISAHLHLANYFECRELSPRKIVELPWQFSKAGEWQRLASLLQDQSFFSATWETNEFDIKRYWAQVEENSSIRLRDAYRPYPEATPQNAGFLWNLARLLHESGHPSESMIISRDLTDIYRENGDLEMLAGSLGTRAVILRERGELDEAMTLFAESEKLFRNLDNPIKVAGALTGQATIKSDHRDLSGALALHQECERIFSELDNPEGLVISIGSQAILQRALGNQNQALQLHQQEERIYRELGNQDGIALSLGNQALVHHDQGNMELALELQRKKERICRELGNPYSLAISLGNQAAILRELGNLNQALALHQEEERICREIGNPQGLATSLHNQAAIFHECGDVDQALLKFREEAQIHRETENLERLAIAIDHQATILRSQGKLKEAVEHLFELGRISRELGNLTALAISLDNRAAFLLGLGDVDEALKTNQEAEQITRELGNPGLLAQILLNQALMYYTKRSQNHAVQLAEEARQLAMQSGITELIGIVESGLDYIRRNQ